MEQTKVIAAAATWQEKGAAAFAGSVFDRIGQGWMLITSGDGTSAAQVGGRWNTMTASWGGMGVLWGKSVAFCFVRPTRNTFDYMNRNDLFTLSFFGEEYRQALSLCGSASGRDTDKAAAAGITPIVFEEGRGAGGIGFAEASDILVCRKLYTHGFDSKAFLDPAIEGMYRDHDYHRMYIGEVLSLLQSSKAR
jgi:flavin reductase (DIM6/NTAB) family NADH-FMN oxidoreductase RutF